MEPGEHQRSVVVTDDGWSGRVDRFITERLGLVSRNQFQKRCNRLLVNGKPAKQSRIVHPGDTVSISLSPEPQSSLVPEDIPLAVLYENNDVVVIDKPRGMVVHPGAGNWSGTLVHGLLHHVTELAESDIDDDIRPGVVHRIDKETSGVLICAKHVGAKDLLASQFSQRSVAKRYVAIVKGRPQPAHGTISGTVARDPSNRKRFRHQEHGGRSAETAYRTLRRFGPYSLVVLFPKTGRTHQLRVHMAHLGTPILGDPLYSRRDTTFADAPLCLHALSLSIVLPGEALPRTFVAPIPADFRSLAARLVTVSGNNRDLSRPRRQR